jgi:hypothetical protein
VQYHALVVFLLPSNPALNRALDASPHEEQAASIEQLTKLGELLSTYPNIQVRLQWLPRKVPFVGFRRARQLLAFEAIRTTDLTDIHEPQSIQKLKDAAKRAAIATWEDRYYNNPRTSMAFKTALKNPPNGKAHHTFDIKPTPEGEHRDREPNGRTGDQGAKVKFSRLTHSTLLRYITGHAFTGGYTNTQEQIACTCGEPLQTVEHVLTECQLYSAACLRHLTANGRPRTLPQLFANSKRVQEVLRFLEETGACAKPRAQWELD